MYVARCDADILVTDKIFDMKKKYREKFGEPFIAFNYADFRGTNEKCAAQVYKEALEKALEGDKPYHIVSHRYDEFDH